MTNTRIGYVKCIICEKEVPRKAAHNARPVKRGRCCYQCNMEVVLPARFEEVWTIEV